jgi:hypothetical protein
MGFALKSNDCQKQSCAIPPYRLYAQNGSTPDETHAFQHDCCYGAQSPARLLPAGMKSGSETLQSVKSLTP